MHGPLKYLLQPTADALLVLRSSPPLRLSSLGSDPLCERASTF